MRILIVEDDGGSRAILQEHLRARQWEVLAAERVEQARSLLAREEVDLILTDIHLPDARGTQHLGDFGRARGQGARPLLVVMTGFPSLETCLDAVQAGAAGYLVKPFKVGEFVELAQRAHEERRLLAQAGALERRVRELEEELSRLRSLPRAGQGEQVRATR